MKSYSLILFFILTIIVFTSEAKKKWLPAVNGYNKNNDENGYAGIMGRAITGLRVSGKKEYRVHIKGGNWLPPVTGNDPDEFNNGYAGTKKGDVIDAVAISGGVQYAAHLKGGLWLPVVTGYDINNDRYGYAGVIGKPIDAIMINGRTYATSYNDSSNSSNTTPSKPSSRKTPSRKTSSTKPSPPKTSSAKPSSSKSLALKPSTTNSASSNPLNLHEIRYIKEYISCLYDALVHYKGKSGTTVYADNTLIKEIKDHKTYKKMIKELKNGIKEKITNSAIKNHDTIKAADGSYRGVWCLTLGSIKLNINYSFVPKKGKNKVKLHFWGTDRWDFAKNDNYNLIQNLAEEYIPSFIAGDGKPFDVKYDFYETVTVEY